MSKIRIVVIILIFAVMLGSGYIYLERNILVDNAGPGGGGSTEDWTRKQADGIIWLQDGLKRFNLAIFEKPIKLVYTPENAQTLKEQSYLNDFSLAINAGYFRGSYISSEHAGMLQIEGELLFRPVPDSQLTHVVVYDQELDDLEFWRERDLIVEDFASPQYTIFQTGPLFIKDSQIQTDFIEKSLNGSSRHLRTVLGITDQGERFFLVTRVSFTLEELADVILTVPDLSDRKISVINLDGGTSSAMYSDSLDEFSFGESKRLPIVLGVE